MIRSIVPVVLVILSSLILRVHCLSAIPGSPCYDTCNGNQATTSGDIVCIDDDFQNTGKGRNLTTCLSCLRSSTYSAGFMGDSTLFLFYLSSVQQTCLSGKPAAPISDCSQTCSNLTSSFSSIGGRAFFQSPYTYCNASDNVYEDDAPSCAKCLRGQEGTVILGNFVNVGNTACQDQPDLNNGGSISGADQMFNATQLINNSDAVKNATITSSSSSTGISTTPTKSAASTSGSQTSKASTTATSSNRSNETSGNGSGGLSRGAAAGIGIALGIIGIAAIIVLAILARRRMLRQQSTRDGANGGAATGAGPWRKMAESPEMQQTTATPRGATPPAAGVFVPPVVAAPKKSKSFKSLRSLRVTPRSSDWYQAANPKSSSDVTALPQRGWD